MEELFPALPPELLVAFKTAHEEFLARSRAIQDFIIAHSHRGEERAHTAEEVNEAAAFVERLVKFAVAIRWLRSLTPALRAP